MGIIWTTGNTSFRWPRRCLLYSVKIYKASAKICIKDSSSGFVGVRGSLVYDWWWPFIPVTSCGKKLPLSFWPTVFSSASQRGEVQKGPETDGSGVLAATAPFPPSAGAEVWDHRQHQGLGLQSLKSVDPNQRWIIPVCKWTSSSRGRLDFLSCHRKYFLGWAFFLMVHVGSPLYVCGVGGSNLHQQTRVGQYGDGCSSTITLLPPR